MSCPDPTPEPGSVQDLEWQLEQAKRRVIDKKNSDYLSTGKFASDLNALVGMAGKPGYGQKQPETLEEKIAWATNKMKELQSAYTDALWKKK